MIDSSGRIIGIVSSKIVGEFVEGIGFGVPVELLFESLNINTE